VAFADEALAHYQVRYQPDDYHLVEVTEVALVPNPYTSPQPFLWTLGDGEWLRVVPLAPYSPRRLRPTSAEVQLPLNLPSTDELDTDLGATILPVIVQI